MADSKQQLLSYPDILIYNGTRFAFNPHKIKYSTPKPTQHGGYRVQLSYPIKGVLADGTAVEKDVTIFLQTPACRTNFGVSGKVHEGKLKSSIDITFFDDADSQVRAFKDVIALWDKLLLQKAKDSKEEWFGKQSKITDDILDFLYIPMIKKNKGKDGREFPDSFRAKVPRRNNTYDADAYNAEEQPISMDEISRESVIKIFCKHSGVYFNNTMFTSSHQAIQIQKISEGKITGFAFVPDAHTKRAGNSETNSSVDNDGMEE